jgi:serine phosphatase RsbU (regulator of sigma subunit)/anti-anti-sigma regulatory factor
MCLDCRRELLEGDPLRVTTRLLDGGRERPHIFQPMRHTSGEFLAATHEVLFARVRLEQRRSLPLPQTVPAALARVAAVQQRLGVPDGAFRRLGMRRRRPGSYGCGGALVYFERQSTPSNGPPMESPNGVGPEGGPSLLVVDDNPPIRELLVNALRPEGFCCIETAESAARARQRLEERSFDIVITDIMMPDGDGIELMQWASEHCPGASWMVLTGNATVDAAVRALQLGAFDFITKPLDSLAGLRKTVRHALEHRRLVAERDGLIAELKERNAQQATHVDQLKAACSLLDEHAESVRADLCRAAFIQQALLPRKAPKLDRHRIHAVYRPSENVAGDVYDVVRLDDRHLVLLVADAAGHGLSAAMLAVLFRNRLPMENPESGEILRPCETLRAVNRSLAAGLTAPGLFITAAYCLLDTQSGRLHMALAGHPPVLVRRSDGSIERFLHTGPALGLYREATFSQHETKLEEGDRLLLHTDGVYERFVDGAAGSEEDLVSILEDDGEAADALIGRLLRGSGSAAAREDDVTLIVLDAAPGASVLDNGELPSAPAPPTPISLMRAGVLVGGGDEQLALCIRGRGDWTQSAAFHRECSSALEARRRAMLDLTLCHHLDSTFLGTIHELAEQAEREHREFRIQGVMPPVEKLFIELGMRAVLERMVSTLLPLPLDMKLLADTAPDPQVRALRLLRAHQDLAALNERNAREFDPLLERLRREVAAAMDPPKR